MYLGWRTFDPRPGKQAFGVEFRPIDLPSAKLSEKSKYLSYWYGNPVALTIYVNANELRFSPNDGQPFAPCLAQSARCCSARVDRRSAYVSTAG
jgi:hypothetical protein